MATYVLVHGAWGSGSHYEGIAARLTAAGHAVHIAQLTGLGERRHLLSPAITLSDHINDVLALIDERGLSNIILAGHSYGGMVISGVASACADRIHSIVYIDAFLPEDGQALWDIATEPERRHYIDAQRGSPGLVGPFPGFPDPSIRHPLLTLLEPVRMSGAEARIPRRVYIFASASPMVVFIPFYERTKADPAWTVHSLATSHGVMQDDPDGLTAILLEQAGD